MPISNGSVLPRRIAARSVPPSLNLISFVISDAISERQHGAIAQTTRTIGLDGEALLKMIARHVLGLPRAIQFRPL